MSDCDERFSKATSRILIEPVKSQTTLPKPIAHSSMFSMVPH